MPSPIFTPHRPLDECCAARYRLRTTMTRTYLDPPCPIAALATPPGTGALAVIKTSGPGAIPIASRCFSCPARLLAAPGNTTLYGLLVDPVDGSAIDEVVVSIFREPRSHTGEDSVEFSCHGSPEVVRRALAALESAGFLPALPGEFSFRALLTGKTDLLRAEAVQELVHSRGEVARAEALTRLEGGLSQRVLSIRAGLLDLLAEVESRLDYPEDEGPTGPGPETDSILRLLSDVESLAATYRIGRLRREGALVVIAGRPNAGKSSLFNLLLREERSIVSEEPGTTRDWIESWIEVDGMAVRLADTAGIRETSSGVESVGIERTVGLVDKADAILYVVDGRLGHVAGDLAFISSHPRTIPIWNKSDCADCLPAPPGCIAASASTGHGFREFVSTLSALLHGNSARSGGGVSTVTESEIIVAGERQKILLDRTAEALRVSLGMDPVSGVSRHERAYPLPNLEIIALHLREAAFHLGEMTGEILSEEILEAVFSRFCLGK